MSRPRTTAGKRNVQQQKREKAQAKQERRAARRLEEPELSPSDPLQTNESELIAELAVIHKAMEMATISPEEFEQRREQIRRQLEQVQRSSS